MSFKSLSIFVGLSCLALFAHALPLQPRQSISTLSTAQISAFKPFSFYASAGYCQPSQILSWTCGTNCDANPTFIPNASGGNGVDVQFWFVGFDPALQTVIVSHQGTDPSKIVPLLTDADFFLDNLDSNLFPGINSDIKVHNGFADEHAKTATSVLAAVMNTIQQHGVNDITVVGHSLGAALALLEGIYLPLFIPGANVKVIGYGMPRVGNQEFADFVDSNLSVTHVNNLKDLVPTIPGRFLGFHHTQGEKHIQPDLSWVDCPGQDNTDDKCTLGTVSNVFEGDIENHDGPYDGVTMGSSTCAA